jgi:hypothetical protein
VVPRGEPQEYEHEDRRLLAVTFDDLVSDLMPAIDWDEIDGGLLANGFSRRKRIVDRPPWRSVSFVRPRNRARPRRGRAAEPTTTIRFASVRTANGSEHGE